jgi:hypothetical protein
MHLNEANEATNRTRFIACVIGPLTVSKTQEICANSPAFGLGEYSPRFQSRIPNCQKK